MKENEIREKLLSEFKKCFGEDTTAVTAFAPGRVNLIGEHTDYNGGHVFPCALTIGTYGIAKRRNDSKLRFMSLNVEKAGIIEGDIRDFAPLKDESWAAYPKGVIWAFLEKGYKIDTGIDMMIYGNIPNGSGLSSSASLEVLTGFLLKKLYNISISNQDIALTGQYSENNYNGMSCGIMDQFASAMGKKDNAIYLNCADLSFEYAPVVLDGMSLVVTNTNKKHKLVGSAYNDRRRECEEATRILGESLGIKALGDLSDEEFERNQNLIGDPVVRKRAKHAVFENNRTLKAVEMLKNGDIKTFGSLMNMSHVSLRDDYEVSCRELDILCEEAWKIDGVIGSRMTGGGFGGCTVSIVKNESLDEFKDRLGRVYLDKVGYECSFYMVNIGDGPREI